MRFKDNYVIGDQRLGPRRNNRQDRETEVHQSGGLEMRNVGRSFTSFQGPLNIQQNKETQGQINVVWWPLHGTGVYHIVFQRSLSLLYNDIYNTDLYPSNDLVQAISKCTSGRAIADSGWYDERYLARVTLLRGPLASRGAGVIVVPSRAIIAYPTRFLRPKSAWALENRMLPS